MARSSASTTLQQGVTFIELLVAMVIIGILAAIAIPYYGDYIDRQRWQGASEAMLGKVQQAKRAAISNNKTIYLIVQNAGSSNWCATISEVSTANSACEGGYVVSSTANQSVILKGVDYPTVALKSSVSSGALFVGFEMPQINVVNPQVLTLGTATDKTNISISSSMLINMNCVNGNNYPGC